MSQADPPVAPLSEERPHDVDETEENDDYVDDLFDSESEDIPQLVKTLDEVSIDKQKPQKPIANTRASIDDQISSLQRHAGKIKLTGQLAGGSGTSSTKDKSDRATTEQVLDPRTRMILFQLVHKNVVSEIHGVLSTGKEANVYYAITEHESDPPLHRAIKVYKTSILKFKDRDQYVTGEFRFRQGYNKSNNRAMVKVWAEKEFRNLKRIYNSGIPCPEPLHLRLHVLVMSFLGDKKGRKAPRLGDVKFEDLTPEEEEAKWQSLYIQLLSYMKTMYQTCRLVHADLSEYNVLYHDSKLYLIDVSQSVEHDHPRSLQFLRMDVKNVSSFFRTRGIDALTERRVFSWITAEGKTDPTAMESEIQTMFSDREARSPEERQSEEADDEVFRNEFIPQTLEQVYDIERDAQLLQKGEGGVLIYQSLLADKVVTKDDDDALAEGEDEDTEDSSDAGSADESRFEKGTPRGKRNMDKDAKRDHKKAVKEEKREKRKEKMPKAVKKKLVSQSSRKK